jgi:hypothetical protein
MSKMGQMLAENPDYEPEEGPDSEDVTEPSELDQAMLDMDHSIKVLHNTPAPGLGLYEKELTTYGKEILRIVGRAHNFNARKPF